MNAPDRQDAVRVPEGVAKIQMTPDEKIPNAATYKVAREDHTLGHLLRMELLRDPTVKFAGYKHPHPLENDILIKVQTSAAATPTEALQRAAGRVCAEYRLLHTEFRQQVQAIQKQQEEIGGDMI